MAGHLSCSVAEAQQRISSHEFSEWMAYYALEPFGEERADLRAAMVCCLIANANRDEKSRKEPYTVQDFMPRFDDPLPTSTAVTAAAPSAAAQGRSQTWQEQKARMMALMPPRK